MRYLTLCLAATLAACAPALRDAPCVEDYMSGRTDVCAAPVVNPMPPCVEYTRTVDGLRYPC